MGRFPAIRRQFLFALSIYGSLGCFMTPRRSPLSIPPGANSVGISYARGFDLETNVQGHLSLLAADLRRGFGSGFDWGLAWTYDFTDGSDGQLSTIWSDLRYQVTNRRGDSFRPMLSLGYGLGQIYNGSGRTVASFPVSLGMKFRTFTGVAGCRIDYIDRKFSPLPHNSTAPRTLWTIGCEIPFRPNKQGHQRRFDFEIGFVNSLYGGPGDNGILFNFVANYDLKP